MPYALIDKNNVVIQIQVDNAGGFIEVGHNVVCGQILQPDGSFKNPEPTSEMIAARRRAEIFAALDEIDRKTIRPLREGETDRVQQLADEARILREELATLS